MKDENKSTLSRARDKLNMHARAIHEAELSRQTKIHKLPVTSFLLSAATALGLTGIIGVKSRLVADMNADALKSPLIIRSEQSRAKPELWGFQIVLNTKAFLNSITSYLFRPIEHITSFTTALHEPLLLDGDEHSALFEDVHSIKQHHQKSSPYVFGAIICTSALVGVMHYFSRRKHINEKAERTVQRHSREILELMREEPSLSRHPIIRDITGNWKERVNESGIPDQSEHTQQGKR